MKSTSKILVALIAVAMTIGAVWQSNRVIVPKQATWDDVLAEAGRGGYRIISTDELARRYGAGLPGLLMVDTRQGWEYRSGHIERALSFPMEPTGWARWRKAGELEHFLGPDKDRFLVFY